jgi:hypothetical protein
MNNSLLSHKLTMMPINLPKVLTAANAATKIKFGQDIPEHLKALYVSALRVKIPQSLQFAKLIIESFGSW